MILLFEKHFRALMISLPMRLPIIVDRRIWIYLVCFIFFGLNCLQSFLVENLYVLLLLNRFLFAFLHICNEFLQFVCILLGSKHICWGILHLKRFLNANVNRKGHETRFAKCNFCKPYLD